MKIVFAVRNKGNNRIKHPIDLDQRQKYRQVEKEINILKIRLTTLPNNTHRVIEKYRIVFSIVESSSSTTFLKSSLRAGEHLNQL